MKNITVSVDDKIYKEVRVLAAQLEISVSELVRRKLGEAIQESNRKNSYELGKDLFGNGSIGSINLSRDRKKVLQTIEKNDFLLTTTWPVLTEVIYFLSSHKGKTLLFLEPLLKYRDWNH